MKKIIYTLIFLAFASITNGQWWPEVQISDAGGSSIVTENNAWAVASNGNSVHVVWMDDRIGGEEIFYKRSTDAGVTWGAEIRQTYNSAASQLACVAISGTKVHIIWTDLRDGNWEIYYKRSTDDGVTWGVDTRLININGESRYPSLSVSGSAVHVVWHDNRDANYEIYYKRSPDEGISWGPDTRLTDNNFVSQFPSISISGSVVHVVWRDNRDGNHEIYYKRSTDGGINWGTDTRLTNNVNISNIPSISVSGSFVHVVWSDNRDGNYEIYYKNSTDAGLTWGADMRLTNNPSLSDYPNVTASGSVVHIAWYDDRDANHEIYYNNSLNGGINWGTDTRLTNNSNFQRNPSVSTSGSVVHVVWYDNRTMNTEIFYKRNPTGNPTGIINVNTEIPEKYSLFQNYPNPFNPITKIRFDVASDSRLRGNDNVVLKIFDVLGREIATLVNEQLQPGTYEVDWDASQFSSGIYYYKILTDGYTETKKMILIK